MANKSVRGFRGWIYAILVAVCLLLIFFAGEILSRVKQPGFHQAPRTAKLIVSTRPRVFPKIATQSIPLEIESLSSPIEPTSWINYRIASGSSIGLLEPPAGARLSAPLEIEIGSDPFLDANRDQRTPFKLAESAANDKQIIATSVSTTVYSNPLNIFGYSFDSTDRSPAASNHLWPSSARLLDEMSGISALAANQPTTDALEWVDRVTDAYTSLTQLSLTDESSSEILELLRSLSKEGVKIADAHKAECAALASGVARLSYSIERRVAVWQAVSICVLRGKTRLIAVRNHAVDSDRLKECLAIVRLAIQKTGDAANWNQYLMLDALNQLAAGDITGQQDQVDLVRQFLGRVTDLRVGELQRAVLASSEIHKLADQVHPLSIGPVDYRKLIEDIETLESEPVHRCSRSLADAMQSLRFSEHSEQADVAKAIGVHYRNANLRMAVSEEFVNRMMPGQTQMEKPVKQNILGAETRGASQIVTKLNVDFIQDPNALRIALHLDGDISSRTQSSRNGATFFNSSIANVDAVREVIISTQGMNINGRPATVESSDSLRKFSTDWDKLPILGDMVRQFAHKEFVQARPIAKRIMQKTIAKQTDEAFDQQLQEKVRVAKGQFSSRLIGPLESLNLQPMVVDMQTTDNRLIVRYRLASSDQMAAYTSRPVAPGDSQLSIQVHQSAFNNMVSQIVEGDRNWTMQDLSDKIADLLQQPRKALPEDAPSDVTARFADSRPLTVEFEDGKMILTLRVALLEQPGRIQLKNFVIRTEYLPTVDGLQAELNRDGIISIDGHKLVQRDRLALRAIFLKVFSTRASVPMVSEELLRDRRAAGLAVSQLVLNDGWLGMAISNEKSPHVAILKANQESLRR